jgi:hypothetical protein
MEITWSALGKPVYARLLAHLCLGCQRIFDMVSLVQQNFIFQITQVIS